MPKCYNISGKILEREIFDNMKKKILLFVLAFAMMFTSLVSVAHADEPAGGGVATLECEGSAYRNIASWATISASTTNWIVADEAWRGNFTRLVDGDYGTGAGSSHSDRFISRYFEWDEAYVFDKISIWVNQNPSGVDSVSGDAGLTNLAKTSYDNGGQSYSFSVYLYDVNGDRILEQTFNTQDQTEIVVVDTGALTTAVKKMEIHEECGWNNTHYIFEVETFATATKHTWLLDNARVTTPATCTTAGEGTYTCSCGVEKVDEIPATGHNPNGIWLIEPAVPEVPAVEDDPATEDVDETAAAIPAVPEKHYQGCLNAGCTEKLDLAEHDWDSDCDLKCDVCSTTRASSSAHDYSFGDCQEYCAGCGEKRTTTVAHEYVHGCDTDCEVCFEERETEHVYTDCADTICDSQNADGSVKCEYERTAPGHTWDNDCDNECNSCGAANPNYVAGHIYDNCDDTVCNECEAPRTAVAHAYTDCDDTECNNCGMTRTAVAHVYDNACDANCNNCNKARTVADHVYDNACDASCNVCNGTRTPADHAYDNACDKTCNVCNAERTVADHVWGEWAENDEGFEERACTICGVKETGDKAGLSGGAIAGIVIGSVAVVGGGGFAAWWFIFKKKAI